MTVDTFNGLTVGQEFESAERFVAEQDIAAFADLSGDRNPIHTNHEFAAATPFRRPIAHGLLGLSLASGLFAAVPSVRTIAFLGLREWHFRAPIYPGDTIRVHTRVLELERRGRGKRASVAWQVRVLNQDGRIVQEGVTTTIVEASHERAEAA